VFGSASNGAAGAGAPVAAAPAAPSAPVKAPAPIDLPSAASGGERGALLDAIRNVGNKSRLRKVAVVEKVGGPVSGGPSGSKKGGKEGKDASGGGSKKVKAPPPQDLMGALREKLAARHKIISGKADVLADKSTPPPSVKRPSMALPRIGQKTAGKKASEDDAEGGAIEEDNTPLLAKVAERIAAQKAALNKKSGSGAKGADDKKKTAAGAPVTKQKQPTPAAASKTKDTKKSALTVKREAEPMKKASDAVEEEDGADEVDEAPSVKKARAAGGPAAAAAAKAHLTVKQPEIKKATPAASAEEEDDWKT